MDQSVTPLVDALQRCATRPSAAFHTPGHKRGQGISPRHRDLFGSQIFRTDLPELPELDNLFAPEGVILQAQALAAEAFGADRTWFLANGSTCGIEAAILATCGPEDKIILPRNVHSSAIAGLILSGATPIYVEPDYSERWDLAVGVSPAVVERAIAQHPTAKAVLLVSPTYQGICSDISAIAHITQSHNIPLIIDEAHGPHFAFHPDLPIPALAAGADLAVQSAHKVLSAFTQAALLHTKGNRIDSHRIARSLQITQSTSPSYLLLGSLDAARHQMAIDGFELLAKAIAHSDRASQAINALPGLSVLQPQRAGKASENGLAGDRTRLTIDVSALGLTGFQADDILHNQFNVTAELPTLKQLTFIISLGNTAADTESLLHGFKQLCKLHPPKPKEIQNQPTWGLSAAVREASPQELVQTQPSVTPRQAFFAPHRPVPIAQAAGQICAETICPYPPGIPALLPGELITKSAIAYLQTLLAASAILTGCQDPQLKTILAISASSHAP